MKKIILVKVKFLNYKILQMYKNKKNLKLKKKNI